MERTKDYKTDMSSKQQKDFEVKINKLVDRYLHVFTGRGKVKLPPIHINIIDTKKEPVVQKLRPVALHLMEPLRAHL